MAFTAFVCGGALPVRGAARRSKRCVRMEALNGDKSKTMKEVYAVVAGSKAPVCRCWQSKKFPLCDGSHNAYNKETGSHVGPLVISATPKDE